MGQDRLARYVWLLETIRKYGKITRKELEKRWEDSGFKGSLTRRTFHNYRNSLEELFGVNIECDLSTFEYYIAEEDIDRVKVTQWMFDNAAVNNIFADSTCIVDRIIVEDIPSARKHLSTVMDAIKSSRRISFSYHSYSRIYPRHDIVFEPYFLKLFRQRWYITGVEISTGREGLRTYALDRMSNAVLLQDQFALPENFDAHKYTRDSFGIVFDMGVVSTVELKVNARRAKYLRALPLHHSQTEPLVGSEYSIFRYQIKPTPDFVEELMSMGSDITVLAPRELREEIKEKIAATLKNYED